IAYLWRATESGALVDWALCVALGLIGAFHLAGLVDARTPLLVADTHGVRVRLGGQWRGLPWDAVATVVVLPRRGLLRDGRLCFSPHSLSRALDGLDARGRRAAALNRTLHGAALAVPMGLTTRISVREEKSLVETLAWLARGRTELVVLPGRAAAPAEQTTVDTQASEDTVAFAAHPGAADSVGRRLVGGIGTVVSRAAKGRSHDLDASRPEPALDTDAETDPGADVGTDVWTLPGLRETNPGRRAEVTRQTPADAAPAVEGRALRRPGSVDLVIEALDTVRDPRVRPISQLGDPVAPLVIEEIGAEPARDPVIGPQLAAARTRVGLSVDELAERTRIRPHVIEAVEVDDFAPCGGDFYARGHLRTLARVLGQDPGPLLEKFDNRYASAPVNARRVFEAELATGTTGGMRRTVGGPQWGLLVGAVLVVALVWGLVRLFATPPQPPWSRWPRSATVRRSRSPPRITRCCHLRRCPSRSRPPGSARGWWSATARARSSTPRCSPPVGTPG
ncbi:MAG: helix-turn-helix domain-containing protein, partial [Nocardioidaceae bacterium]